MKPTIPVRYTTGGLIMSVMKSTHIAMAVAGVLVGFAAPLYAQSQSAEKDMVAVPRGEFTMGSSEHSDEVKHQVVVDAFLLDKYEAYNQRDKEFMKETGHPA